MRGIGFYVVVAWVYIIGFVMTGRAGGDLGATVERGEVTFRVWAPHAGSVDVIGDFNGWKGGRDSLSKNPGGIWEGTVKRAKPGQGYKYLINGALQKRDPRARRVEGDRSIIYDPKDFNWQNDKSPSYDISELVVYEMHVGAFNDPHSGDGISGTFSDAIKRLPELQELGINCVQLMPVHEFDGESSWGYNPSDVFAVESAYGGPDGLKEFVKACHARGMVVHLDIVHNHYGPQNLDMLQFDGTGGAESGGIYFYEGAEKGVTPWGPRVKFEDPQVRQFIQDNVVEWIEEFHIDGFRWDSTVNIRAYDMGKKSLPEGMKMLNDINDMMHRTYPGIISIAEDSLDIGKFDGSWEYDFHHHLMPVFKTRNDQDRDMNAVSGVLTRYPSSMQRVVYVDNHDEAGKMNGEMRIASDIDPENPTSDYARRLSGLASLLTLTAPGIPLLLQGNEMLESGPFHDDLPIDWNNWRKQEGFVRLHKDLIHLRRNLEGKGKALEGLECRIAAMDNDEKNIVYWRSGRTSKKDIMVIAANFSGKEQTMDVPLPGTGQWDLLVMTDWQIYGGLSPYKPNESFNLSKSSMTFTLPPYSAALFGSKKGALATRVSDAQLRPVEATSEEFLTPMELPPARKRPEDCFSVIRGVTVHAVQDGVERNWPMELFNDDQWECFVKLDAVNQLTCFLSDADQSITWRATPPNALPLPAEVTMSRDGASDLTLHDIPPGWIRFGFNEASSTFSISTDPYKGQVNRTWTLITGKTFSGRLVAASHTLAMFAQESGKYIKFRIQALQSVDQDRVFRFIFDQWD